jgi:hypothetical protein
LPRRRRRRPERYLRTKKIEIGRVDDIEGSAVEVGSSTRRVGLCKAPIALDLLAELYKGVVDLDVWEGVDPGQPGQTHIDQVMPSGDVTKPETTTTTRGRTER